MRATTGCYWPRGIRPGGCLAAYCGRSRRCSRRRDKGERQRGEISMTTLGCRESVCGTARKKDISGRCLGARGETRSSRRRKAPEHNWSMQPRNDRLTPVRFRAEPDRLISMVCATSVMVQSISSLHTIGADVFTFVRCNLKLHTNYLVRVLLNISKRY
jgi:hypothetical protein